MLQSNSVANEKKAFFFGRSHYAFAPCPPTGVPVTLRAARGPCPPNPTPTCLAHGRLVGGFMGPQRASSQAGQRPQPEGAGPLRVPGAGGHLAAPGPGPGGGRAEPGARQQLEPLAGVWGDGVQRDGGGAEAAQGAWPVPEWHNVFGVNPQLNWAGPPSLRHKTNRQTKSDIQATIHRIYCMKNYLDAYIHRLKFVAIYITMDVNMVCLS